jgi:hypothetical protein
MVEKGIVRGWYVNMYRFFRFMRSREHPETLNNSGVGAAS